MYIIELIQILINHSVILVDSKYLGIYCIYLLSKKKKTNISHDEKNSSNILLLNSKKHLP